jgi:hypothetical protein
MLDDVSDHLVNVDIDWDLHFASHLRTGSLAHLSDLALYPPGSGDRQAAAGDLDDRV